MKNRILLASLLAAMALLIWMQSALLAGSVPIPAVEQGADQPGSAGIETTPSPPTSEPAVQPQVVDGSEDLPLPATPELLQPRVVGGREATPGAWPWMAAIVDSRYSSVAGGWYCGGALIHPSWVLTAAHCTYRNPSAAPLPASGIDVALGKHKLSDSGGERIDVIEIIRHPNYDGYTFNFDLALLRLARPSRQPVLSLVPSNDTTLTAPGQMATVLGWGDTRANGTGSYADALQEASMPIVSNKTCNSVSSYTGDITNNMLCAGVPQGGKDACAGDSGGPLMVPDGNGSWLQAGIVSWGYDCAQPNYYGVYTRASQFTSWIQNQISTKTPATNLYLPFVNG